MKLEELLEVYKPSSKENKASQLKQEKYFRQAFGDNEPLCDAFVICKILNLDVVKNSGVDLMDVAKVLIGRARSANNEYDEEVLHYVERMLDKETEEHQYFIDVQKLCPKMPPDNEPLGYINEEVQRAFLLKIRVDKADVQSNIEETLYQYSKVFNLSTFEFQEVAKTNRIGMIEELFYRVYNEGDLLLMDQFKNIYNNILDWR